MFEDQDRIAWKMQRLLYSAELSRAIEVEKNAVITCAHFNANCTKNDKKDTNLSTCKSTSSNG